MKKAIKLTKWTHTALYGAILGLAAPAIYAADFGVMADVKYSHNNSAAAKNEGQKSMFGLGQVDIYATQKIDSKTKAFLEYVFEDPDGTGFALDLERLYVNRKVADALEISLGRTHINMGHWNATYHHGALIQDTISRPTFLEFEDDSKAAMPMHIVGLNISGGDHGIAMGGGTFNYGIAVGNGASANTSVITGSVTQTAIDVNNTRNPGEGHMVNVRLTYQPARLPLEVGISHTSNPVVESSANDSAGAKTGLAAYGKQLASQAITGFDIYYAGEKLDFLSEYYNIKNDNKTGALQNTKASAYFVQLGYRITDRVRPIYRYESMDYKANDDYYMKILSPERGKHHVLGLRWELDDSNALKFEVNRFNSSFDPVSNPTKAKSSTSYALQWAFMMM